MLQGRRVVGEWVQTGSISQMREASPERGGRMPGSHGRKALKAGLGVGLRAAFEEPL